MAYYDDPSEFVGADWGPPVLPEDLTRITGGARPAGSGGGGGMVAYNDPNYVDPDQYTQPDTSGPVWGDPYSLYGWITGFNPINQWDQQAGDIATAFGSGGNRNSADYMNEDLWSQYGYGGRNANEMRTAEGADRFGSDLGQYDPTSIDMLNRMSGNAYRGASWDPWNMGWSQREADTARMIDAEGWDDPRYRQQREDLTNNGAQPWDEERRIYDEYGNIASGGGNPYRDPMEGLATQNARGEGRYEPMRGALATEFMQGDARYTPQRGALATEFGSGRGMYEDPQSSLVGNMAGGRNADETSTMGQVNQFGFGPGQYQGQRQDIFSRFASGGGGYDDPTKQALKQSASIPLQNQLGGIEQAVNRQVAKSGNSAGMAGALVRGRLDAANQVARNMNQAQVQIADAQRQDQSTGLAGLGQLQGETDARAQYALNAQQGQNAADRARQAQAAGMYGQMSGAGDARKQAAAGLYGNMAAESTAMKQAAANMYGQMAQESDQRWNSAFNQYNQLGQNQLASKQLGLNAQQGMLGQQRGYQQQAFNNLGQLQGERNAQGQQALQNRMAMENAARAREAQALQGSMGLQGQADDRYRTQLQTEMAMNQADRDRQQAAMSAGERAIDRRNTNQLAGAQMTASLGNKQTQGQLANIQNFFQLLGQQAGGANQLGSLISALTSLPIHTEGVGEQSGSQSGAGFSI